MDSEIVSTPGILECPVSLEAIVKQLHPVGEDNEKMKGRIVIFELEIVNVRVHSQILIEGKSDRINPDTWRRLIMSFQHFYGLGDKIHPSSLPPMPENLYKIS